jgi:hypothetical protein
MEKEGKIMSEEKKNLTDEERKKLKDEELDKVSGGYDLTDINSEAYSEAIKQLASEKFINGYDYDQFKPKESITNIVNKIVKTGVCPLCSQTIFSKNNDVDIINKAKKHVYDECIIYKNK